MNGDGGTKAFANIEKHIWKWIARPLLTLKTNNENVTKYECLWAFMVTVIARPLLTLKTYMEMGK